MYDPEVSPIFVSPILNDTNIIKAIIESRLHPSAQFAATVYDHKMWRHLVNTLEVYHYLLEHGTHTDTANATRHTAIAGK